MFFGLVYKVFKPLSGTKRLVVRRIRVILQRKERKTNVEKAEGY